VTSGQSPWEQYRFGPKVSITARQSNTRLVFPSAWPRRPWCLEDLTQGGDGPAFCRAIQLSSLSGWRPIVCGTAGLMPRTDAFARVPHAPFRTISLIATWPRTTSPASAEAAPKAISHGAERQQDDRSNDRQWTKLRIEARSIDHVGSENYSEEFEHSGSPKLKKPAPDRPTRGRSLAALRSLLRPAPRP
jgi:hypothetical protein